jgi:hypothetical protein
MTLTEWDRKEYKVVREAISKATTVLIDNSTPEESLRAIKACLLSMEILLNSLLEHSHTTLGSRMHTPVFTGKPLYEVKQ